MGSYVNGGAQAKVFEHKILRVRILALTSDKIGEWQQLQNEGLHNL